MKERFLGIIPARYASSRFPGKPLALLGRKPMIQWVWERASACFDDLVVATDDERIHARVLEFGGKAVMTSPLHSTGTERCAEALEQVEKKEGASFSHVVNIQGDEPMVHREQLNLLKAGFSDPGTDIATLVHALENPDDLDNPNVVKVVMDAGMHALYFSRSPIPHHRESSTSQGISSEGISSQGISSEEAARKNPLPYYRHLGLYAYRAEVLRRLVALDPAPLEIMESLEQLRWITHGYRIRTLLSDQSSVGVDTPEDLEKLQKLVE